MMVAINNVGLASSFYGAPGREGLKKQAQPNKKDSRPKGLSYGLVCTRMSSLVWIDFLSSIVWLLYANGFISFP